MSSTESAVGGDDDFVQLDQLGNVLEEEEKQQPQQQQQQGMCDPRMVDGEELRSQLLPVWQKLWNFEPYSIPFRYPVDPVALDIPDYFNFVKNPIDLHTIRTNLDEGKYKNAWQFCDHVWLMFENAWLYNPKKTKVHEWCTKMSELFIREINPVVHNLGYCCGQRLSNVECSWFEREALLDLDWDNKRLKAANENLKGIIAKLEGQVLEDKLSKELQRKMDEFKEEYAKKLSLQNDQMEELKTAFSVCQQKVEEFKEKLNGMKGIEEEEAQQQKMALTAAPMPTTKSPMDSTISDKQDNAYKINNSLGRIENKIVAMQNMLAKQISTSISSIVSPSPTGLGRTAETQMSVEEKMAIMIDKHKHHFGGSFEGSANLTENTLGDPQQEMEQPLHSVCIGPNIHEMPPPEPPSKARDWHASVTPHLRSHLIGKLVKAICPFLDPASTHDLGQLMDKWITNATKLEKEMFEMAPDKAAYYHMLTQRIYKIQKEIEEKKNRGLRLNEQLKIAFGLPQQHDRSSSNTVQEQKTK